MFASESEVTRRWWSRDSLCGVMRGVRSVRMSSVGRGGDRRGMLDKIAGRETSTSSMSSDISTSTCWEFWNADGGVIRLPAGQTFLLPSFYLFLLHQLQHRTESKRREITLKSFAP